MIEGLKPFTRGETVYFMKDDRIHKSTIKAVYEVDNLTTKYLVDSPSAKRWMLDSELFHSLKEILSDLQSCIEN